MDPNEREEPLIFPLKGIDLTQPVSLQPPQTTPLGNNVRAFEAMTQRDRGGVRPGLRRYINQTVDGTALIQELNSVVIMGPGALLTQRAKVFRLKLAFSDMLNMPSVFSGSFNGNSISLTDTLNQLSVLYYDTSNGALAAKLGGDFPSNQHQLLSAGIAGAVGANQMVVTYTSVTGNHLGQFTWTYWPYTSTDAGVTWTQGTPVVATENFSPPGVGTPTSGTLHNGDTFNSLIV